MGCSSLTTFTMDGENYDSWRNSAVAYIILQALQSSRHLVTYRICILSSFRERSLGYWFYVNQWILGRCNVYHDCLREVRFLINHIFGSLHCFSYIQTTHFQALLEASTHVPTFVCHSHRDTRHFFGDFFSPLLWALNLPVSLLVLCSSPSSSFQVKL